MNDLDKFLRRLYDKLEKYQNVNMALRETIEEYAFQSGKPELLFGESNIVDQKVD